MNSPYFVTGPALISFSGGRSSAYMLKQILDAHGGVLPDDVNVCFANTGKEREETLRFVHECATRWDVHVHWLEYRAHRGNRVTQFEEVGFNSASRSGEPFDALIAAKSGLPNWQARWCTSYLKVLVMFAFMESSGHPQKTYSEWTGLRADEGWRVAKMHGRNADDGRQCRAPLASAGVTVRNVRDFWNEQPFDLGLESGEGNCDLCFMKGKKLRSWLMRLWPDSSVWWAGHEHSGRFFDRRTRYADLSAAAARSPDMLLGDVDQDEEFDSECGLWCPGEAA